MKKLIYLFLAVAIIACSDDSGDGIIDNGDLEDIEPPVITLIGDTNVNVFQYTTYEDAGATATDNFDGDLTSNIVTSGEVNSIREGTYVITYSVSDAAGNSATSTRQVNVVNNPNNPVFLVSNGITVRARDWAVAGITGQINEFTYTVVDEAMLRDMIENGDDVTKVATTLVTNMSGLFQSDPSFNKEIGSWDVINVTTMASMFEGSGNFNKDIGKWNVRNVTDMSKMFKDATNFNRDLDNWNVSNVTDMSWMFFRNEQFNRDIGDWNVSNVTNMTGMFEFAESFNREIGDWDVSNVTDMYGMFRLATTFNKDIRNWDVGNVTDMGWMFQGASSFNQDLSAWNVAGVVQCGNFSFVTPLWILPKPNFTNCNP